MKTGGMATLFLSGKLLPVSEGVQPMPDADQSHRLFWDVSLPGEPCAPLGRVRADDFAWAEFAADCLYGPPIDRDLPVGHFLLLPLSTERLIA